MAQTTYQVILSTDGKHTVIVQSDSPTDMKVAGAWARSVYDSLVERYGLKHEQYQRNGESNPVPTCEVHGLPMTQVNGRKGPFWSCHQKNPDGTWCSYRPKDQ